MKDVVPIPQIRNVIQQNVRRGGDSYVFRHHHIGFGRRPSGRRGFSIRKLLTWLIVAGLAGFFAASVAFIGLVAWFAKDLPDPENINFRALAQTTKIYDRTGKNLLYEIHGDQKRTVVGLDQVSPYIKDATIAAEDKDFYKHKGFDIKGYLRAFYKNLLRGGKVQGGSTITQQFIKNSVLTNEKTYTRKLKELVLSIEIERRFTKDQILKLYLNEIPYGSVVYGIESASQTFLGKPAKDLTIAESAFLASIPKAPTYYSPFGSHLDDLVARSRYVIDIMKEQGMITAEEAAQAKKDDILSRVQPKIEAIRAPHFVFYVRDLLAAEFGEEAVNRGGFKVTTTLDWDKQQLAEQAVADNLANIKKWGGSTAALLSLNPRNGEVLAMVGSADYFDDSIDGKYNALMGKIQPGSSIKPFVYAAAFEKGYTPDTVVYDVATQFQKPPNEYAPADYDGQERGPVTLKEALAGSLNIPAVKTLYLVGVKNFLDFASQKLGYSTFDDRSRFGLSIVLGGADVKPFEHIAAFSVFPREGLYRPTQALLKVEDNSGRILLDNSQPVPEKRVLSQETARQINGILSDNAARAFIFGEHNFLTLADRPVAAKTGTTNKFTDVWTIGYTPSLVTGVWVGNSEKKEMKDKADGSKVAAPIWNQYMTRALAGTPVEEFTAPQPVTTGKPVLDGFKNAQFMLKIDKVSGKIATADTPPELVEERGFGVPHDILFFCDKNDPRGPIPEHPELDPQFQPWEDGVAAWAARQNLIFQPPPMDIDDVHTPENKPSLSFIRPAENGVVSERNAFVQVSAQARRGIAKVEYLLDGQPVGSFTYPPFGGQIIIPNRFSKGFHTLSAAAYDDAGNSATTSLTINLTAEPGPLDVAWLTPGNSQYLSAAQFPFNISFRIDDYKSIDHLRLAAVNAADQTEQTIGSVNDPVLPNFSMTWQRPAAYGRYSLRIEAGLDGGAVRTAGLTVYVTQ